MASIGLRMARVRLFTNTERVVLRVWFDLDQAGFEVDADRLLNSGLLLEHLQSTVDDDPNKRSPEEVAELATLESDFRNELSIAAGILGGERHNSAKAALSELSPTGHETSFGGSTAGQHLPGLGRAPRSQE